MLQINSKKKKKHILSIGKITTKNNQSKKKNRHKEKFGWMPKLYNFSLEQTFD